MKNKIILTPAEKRELRRRHTAELCIFALFGALMLVSKKLMEGLPNIHLNGMFIVMLTVVYRTKALIPIYTYIFLDGLFGGFGLWWLPYLYIWALLWGAVMLLPKTMSKKTCAVVYPLVSAMHGLLFGILYSPAYSLMYKLSFEETVKWVIAGIPADIYHVIGNLISGLLILPGVTVLKRLDKKL